MAISKATTLIVPVFVGVVVVWLLRADVPEARTWVVLPIVIGSVVVGRLVGPWWATLLAFYLGVGGLAILAFSPIDDDVARWTTQALVTWMAALGVVVGLFLRAIAAGVRRVIHGKLV